MTRGVIREIHENLQLVKMTCYMTVVGLSLMCQHDLENTVYDKTFEGENFRG